jgi:2-haloalkanoic acid dehalogenase type II
LSYNEALYAEAVVEPQQEDRRLTTIVSADVVGYSRLMASNESETLAQLKAHRKELVEPKIAEHHGRIVKFMGDGTLMEFGSVVDAVKFAIDFQQAVAERNSSLPNERRIVYRIGINIGDIIVEGDDIYGDGVNIAARLEQLADPGGVCIARNVFNQVKNKLDIEFRDLGEQELKNILETVRAYRIVIGDQDARPAGFDAVTPSALPDKPSIAVLPFANLSGDQDQEYLSDGITEDIIMELSRFSALFVVSRNQSFAFKGPSVDFAEVGARLGVQFVVGGSVRKAGKRVRVTAELADAATGSRIWIERYDRELDDIFEMQDDLSRAIVSKIAGHFDVTTEQVSDFKLLTFDCYGTLIDWETGILDALRPLVERADISDNTPGRLADQVLEKFAQHEAAQQKETPTMRYSDLLAVVYKNLAIRWDVMIAEAEAQKFGQSVRDWPPFPDTVDALAYLNRHYEKLVILSNVDRDSFADTNKLLKVKFGDIYTAEEIGSYKPALRNFEYMLEQLKAQGFSKSDILHVAQSKFHDLMPATEIGLATAWIDRSHDKMGWGGTKAPRKDARININFHFRSLSELVDRHKAETDYTEEDGIEKGYGDFYKQD